VLQDKVATLMFCGQTDCQSGKHPWRLFRIFVRLEVGAFLVQQHLVQLGTNHWFRHCRNAQCIAALGQDFLRHPVLPPGVETDDISSVDLPGLPDTLVDDGFSAFAKGRLVAGLLNSVDVPRRHRQAHITNILDLDGWIREGLAGVLVQKGTRRLCCACAETGLQLFPHSVEMAVVARIRVCSRHDETAAVEGLVRCVYTMRIGECDGRV
jgi:hypothetical protein